MAELRIEHLGTPSDQASAVMAVREQLQEAYLAVAQR